MDQDLNLSKAGGDMEDVGGLSTRGGLRGRGEKEVMSTILGISSIADLCLLFKLPQIASGHLHSCSPSFPPEAGVQSTIGVP